jgi:glycosyltransferase involved in cell wall biosynthesis
VSDATKKSLVKYIKINPKKIRIIYNSAPDLKITVAPSLRLKLRRELGIGEDDFVVGSMGRLKEHKGYSYLLEAMAKILCRLKEQNINCKCVIVGDGAARKDLEFKAKSLGLADIVIFTGWRKDIENLLLTMDIFIQPSTIWEGLPLALAEAASCGLTLIATDIGDNCEIVKEGVNGFIVPPRNSDALAEKIQYLIKEPLELKKMSENSRRIWQEKFTLDEMVKKIGDLYAQYI